MLLHTTREFLEVIRWINWVLYHGLPRYQIRGLSRQPAIIYVYNSDVLYGNGISLIAAKLGSSGIVILLSASNQDPIRK
jgi:hypothetical protein